MAATCSAATRCISAAQHPSPDPSSASAPLLPCPALLYPTLPCPALLPPLLQSWLPARTHVKEALEQLQQVHPSSECTQQSKVTR